jgi:hypothetical protein
MVSPGVSRGTRIVLTPLRPAVDDPFAIAGAHCGGLDRRQHQCRAVIVDADLDFAVWLVMGESEVIAIVLDERGEKAFALFGRHQLVEQDAAEPRGFGQCRADIRIAGRELFGNDAGGERIGARASQILRQRKRPQPHLRRLVEHIERQAAVAGVEP